MFLPQAFLQERWQPAKIAGNDVNETDSKTCPAKDGVEILGIPGPLKWQNPMQWKENWLFRGLYYPFMWELWQAMK